LATTTTISGAIISQALMNQEIKIHYPRMCVEKKIPPKKINPYNLIEL
jgi:hypothetical protein